MNGKKYYKKQNPRYDRHHLSPHLTGLKILFGSKYWIWSYQTDKLSYVTPYHISDQVSKYADLIYRKSLDLPGTQVIWDMFGGIGSDSMTLSRYFSIITTELDQDTYECLQKNIKSFRLHNVNAIQGNCLDFIQKIHPDIIYYDPPWGENYKSKSPTFDFNEVYIDFPTPIPNLPVKIKSTDLLTYLHTHISKKIIVKSPINSTSFEDLFQPHQIKSIFYYPPKNLKFIYLI